MLAYNLSAPSRAQHLLRAIAVAAVRDARTACCRDFCYDFAPGERIGIVGRNGAGKVRTSHYLVQCMDVVSGLDLFQCRLYVSLHNPPALCSCFTLQPMLMSPPSECCSILFYELHEANVRVCILTVQSTLLDLIAGRRALEAGTCIKVNMIFP